MSGEATAVLRALLAVEPLYWTSFYERARFFRGRPSPSPPEVIFDLTKDCPLDCDFCFAADTLHSGARIRPPQLAPLAEALRGLPRVLLLGGEPLTHPELDACLDLLDEPGRRVCIYTNGLALPEEAGRRRAWLGRRFGRLRARVELTLSLDHHHRAQLGDAAFATRIEAMLGLLGEPDAPVDVRFNVTAGSLSTGGYLVPRRVEAALDALHPELSPLFRRAMRAGEVDRIFQFNPVIRMGRAAAGEGELLNAGDTLLKPQVVLGPRQDGGIALVSSLPATWMPRVPEPLVMGPVGAGGLAEGLLAGPVAELLGAELFPEVLPAFRALLALRRGGPEAGEAVARARTALRVRRDVEGAEVLREALQAREPDALAAALRVHGARVMSADWGAWRGRWHDRLAGRLARLCAGGGQAWDLGGDRPHRRLVLATLRRFVALHLGASPALASAFVERCASLAVEPLARGGYAAFCGYAEREGLITDRPESPLPLAEVPLDQGLATPYFGDALVRPRVVPRMAVQVGGELSLELDGVGAVPWAAQTGAEEPRLGQAALLGMLEFLLPPALHMPFREALSRRGAQTARALRDGGAPPGLVALARTLGALTPLPVREEPVGAGRPRARLLLGDAAPALRPLARTHGADHP